MIAIGEGAGGCGNCGHLVEKMTAADGSTLAICGGCGIVVGKGVEARRRIDAEVTAGRAYLIDAAPGFVAMRVIGGPST